MLSHISANPSGGSSSRSPDWTAVLIFYAIACAISWPFFWWFNVNTASWNHSSIPTWVRWMCLMWGPGVGALFCLVLFRRAHRRTITFWGNSRLRSACFYLVPIAALAFVHPPAARLLFGVVRNPGAAHLTVGWFVLAAILSFCRVLGEELGWRGFLQDAVRPMPFYPRFVFIGFLWAFWHFTNYTTNRPLHVVVITLAIFFPSVIVLAFIIGIAVERSHSLCVAVTLHAWVDLAIYLGTERTWTVFGVSLLFWAYLLWRWPQTAGRSKPELLGSPS